jgi:hypothetical protein
MRPSPWVPLAALLGLAATAGAGDWKGHARIDGHVMGEDGASVAGATVKIDRLSGEPGPRVSSGPDGSWVVDGIASGSWMIVIEAPGHRPSRVGIHLPGESSWLAPVEVRLEEMRATRPPPEMSSPAPPRASPDAPEGPATPAAVDDVRRALEAGRVEQARAFAASVEWDAAGGTDGLLEIGAAFLDAGAPAEAAAFLDVAIDATPGDVEAHYRRALALLALGREGEARDDFETIVELRPGGAFAAKARQALEVLPPGSAGE